MSFIENSISILASSEAKSGARNKSSDGSYFEVYLSDASKIPDQAQHITIEVEKATIWWTIPNLSTTNNQIYVTGPNTIDVVQSRLITVPSGLYDITLLKNAILLQMQNEGFKQSPLPVIDLSADAATGRVILKLNYSTSTVDFTVANAPNSMHTILGFDQSVYSTITAPFNITAPHVAGFNTINSLLIKTNLVDDGISLNGVEDDIVAQVLIDVTPGSQIVYEPTNPTKSQAHQLRGRLLRDFHVELTDENRNRVNTFGEAYTVLFKIAWREPFTIG